uniref:Carotenoid oxygenase n=1 Tax=Corethron hystrix TaxID=216773 RepID=A0A7S1B8L9_9STRA|mmetsp:Transcript_17388/g.39246  ORF Transcript_17388/g.39246 Transcript_17388/m.39246 type:complete len:595 (+) Transcript_17388:99-1883(+)
MGGRDIAQGQPNMRFFVISVLAASKFTTCRAFSNSVARATAAAAAASADAVKEAQLRAEEAARNVHSGPNNAAMNALFVNVPDFPEPSSCTVVAGAIPDDLPPGCLMRTGPNGGSENDGFLDGDGMVHCITFPPKEIRSNERGVAHSSTYVETQGRLTEKRARNGSRYAGTLGAAPRGWPMLGALLKNGLAFGTLEAQKDTCNTALARSGGRVLALMEQSPPTEVRVRRDGSLETVERMARLGGAVPSAPISGGSLGAHGRTCPEMGERVHVSYTSVARPFVRVDYFDPGWKLKRSVGVDVPAPVMVHDCALSESYVVLMDFPLTIRPRRLIADSFPVEYEPGNGARIGLLPRSATSDQTIWFDVENGVVLHAANAYEEDDGKVVVIGFKSVPKGEKSFILDYTPAFLYKWVLDPSTGKTEERCLRPDICVEFPVCEDRLVGKKSRYVYGVVATSMGGPMRQFKTPQAAILLDSVIKLAVLNGEDGTETAGDVAGRFDLPDGWHFVSEPTLLEKTSGAGTYVLALATYVPTTSDDGEKAEHIRVATDGSSMKSRCYVLDGVGLGDDPVCVIDLPKSRHVNYGLHSLYLPWKHMV